MSQRKLHRPKLGKGHDPRAGRGRGPYPPQYTRRQEEDYLELMRDRVRVEIEVTGGERIRGRIEWYDRSSVQVQRDDEISVLLFKVAIVSLRRLDDV